MRTYYEDEHATIYHGDCVEVMRSGLIPLMSVDTTVTSPPYNQLGERMPSKPSGLHSDNAWMAKVTERGYGDDMDEGEYLAWQQEEARLVYRLTKHGGSFFYNHKIRYRDRVPLHPLDIVRSFDSWILRQEIVWDRRRSVVLNARMFAPSDERIYWLYSGDFRWNQEALAMSVWPIVPEMDQPGHPCPYPVQIAQRCILATTDPGDTILDPFMGSGTTLFAAKGLGRKAIGVEREERYCEVAAERLSQGVLDLGDAA